MKKRDIDTVIREALKEEDREFLDAVEEPKLSEQVTSLFQGRWRYVNAISMVSILLLFVLAVFCGVKFFKVNEIPQMLRWGAGLFLCWFGVAYLKLWTWLELERHAVTREIKRLELQVAHLAALLGPSQRPEA